MGIAARVVHLKESNVLLPVGRDEVCLVFAF